MVSLRDRTCPKDKEKITVRLVAGGYGEPRLYCFKVPYQRKCPKDKRKRVCEFDLEEDKVK